MPLRNPFFVRKNAFSRQLCTTFPYRASGRHCGCGKRRLSNSHWATLKPLVGWGFTFPLVEGINKTRWWQLKKKIMFIPIWGR